MDFASVLVTAWTTMVSQATVLVTAIPAGFAAPMGAAIVGWFAWMWMYEFTGDR